MRNVSIFSEIKPHLLMLDLRKDHNQKVEFKLSNFFKQNSSSEKIFKKPILFIIGIPDHRAQIERGIKVLCKIKEKGLVSENFSFQQHVHYVFRDDVLECHPLSLRGSQKTDQNTGKINSIVSDILEDYKQLIPAIADLQEVAKELAIRFDKAANDAAEFSTHDCKLAFLASVVQIAIKFELGGDRLKDYLYYAQTCRIVFQHNYKLFESLPLRIQKKCSKTFDFLTAAIEKVNNPTELARLQYAKEKSWSQFIFTPLKRLLEKMNISLEVGLPLEEKPPTTSKLVV